MSERVTQLNQGWEHIYWSRFEEKFITEPNSGCWLWIGAIKNNGYGNFAYGNKFLLAHRFAYMALVGDIPNGYEIDHLCRVRCCINPDHLEAVTTRVNVLRSGSLSAKNARKTHCPNGHPLSGDNLVGHWLRKGMRLCRICYNARKRIENRARYAAKRVFS